MLKGITPKGIIRKGITQEGITLKGITQKSITQKGITRKVLHLMKGITRQGIKRLICKRDNNSTGSSNKKLFIYFNAMDDLLEQVKTKKDTSMRR